jgi:multimeric flavodoxin WrbA
MVESTGNVIHLIPTYRKGVFGMDVLAVLGSYRKGEGNTAALLDMLLAEMGVLGASCENIWLPSLSIGGCRGCNWCQDGGTAETGKRCLINDGMQELYGHIERSQALIVATPVYMWHVSSQTKAFIDRLYTYADGELAGKRLAAVMTAGGDAFDGLDLAVQSLNRFAACNHMEYCGTLYCAPLKNRRDLQTRDLPRLARELAACILRKAG